MKRHSLAATLFIFSLAAAGLFSFVNGCSHGISAPETSTITTTSSSLSSTVSSSSTSTSRGTTTTTQHPGTTSTTTSTTTTTTTTTLSGSWSSVVVGVPNNLRGISFRDASNGFIVGEGGLILSTSDGGLNWSPVTTSIPSTITIDAISISQNPSFTFHMMVVGQGGLAAFTGNGGGSWNVRTDMAPSGQELYDCLCVEPTREFYVYGNFADTHLMEVSTEGTTSSSIERTGEGSSLRKYLTMDTFDGVNMMASGADQSSAIMPLKYSINGGVTWQFVLSQGYTNKSVNGIFMDTNSTGILVGNNGFVAYTNLSTASQINLTDPVLSQNHNNFYAIYGLRDGSQAWAVGQGGIIYHYTNIGGTKTWTKQAAPSNDPTDLYAVFFIDASNGWIAGNSGHVYKYAP